MTIADVGAIADAVLYEGYLLYPYRASSRKNQSRWQFGVLGPPGASAASFGEEPGMAMECLLTRRGPSCAVTITLRFLQLQVREVQRLDGNGGFVAVEALTVDGVSMTSWDEAVECEVTLPTQSLLDTADTPLEFEGGQDVEPLRDANGEDVGRVVRRRAPLTARLRTHAAVDDGFVRLSVSVENEHAEPVDDKDAAIRVSLISAHLLLEAHEADFVSLLEPPDDAAEAAARCHQRRCWPILAGAPGTTGVVLGSPIILYDYPEVAEESAGALFDSTEIDEILTLRVMTMTDDEKAQARATDPRAAEIIDRCDQMSAADLQQLHGVLRDPRPAPTALSGGAEHADLRNVDPPDFDTGDVPWWDPAADENVQPEVDAVMIDGVSISRGSLVRVHPSRRSDAQDLFYADQVARVAVVVSDVEGNIHVGLVLVDDPATDMHDWYGRYFYFAPDELEPLPAGVTTEHREESQS